MRQLPSSSAPLAPPPPPSAAAARRCSGVGRVLESIIPRGDVSSYSNSSLGSSLTTGAASASPRIDCCLDFENLARVTSRRELVNRSRKLTKVFRELIRQSNSITQLMSSVRHEQSVVDRAIVRRAQSQRFAGSSSEASGTTDRSGTSATTGTSSSSSSSNSSSSNSSSSNGSSGSGDGGGGGGDCCNGEKAQKKEEGKKNKKNRKKKTKIKTKKKNKDKNNKNKDEEKKKKKKKQKRSKEKNRHGRQEDLAKREGGGVGGDSVDPYKSCATEREVGRNVAAPGADTNVGQVSTTGVAAAAVRPGDYSSVVDAFKALLQMRRLSAGGDYSSSSTMLKDSVSPGEMGLARKQLCSRKAQQQSGDGGEKVDYDVPSASSTPLSSRGRDVAVLARGCTWEAAAQGKDEPRGEEKNKRKRMNDSKEESVAIVSKKQRSAPLLRQVEEVQLVFPPPEEEEEEAEDEDEEDVDEEEVEMKDEEAMGGTASCSGRAEDAKGGSRKERIRGRFSEAENRALLADICGRFTRRPRLDTTFMSRDRRIEGLPPHRWATHSACMSTKKHAKRLILKRYRDDPIKLATGLGVPVAVAEIILARAKEGKT